MKFAVIGAGIVGITSAYELAIQGHEVTVFERRSSVAEEASFANAGILAPGWVAPWAAPGMPWRLLRSLLSRSPAALRPASWSALPWLRHWRRACNTRTHTANRAAMHTLARFSRDRTLELTRGLRLEYEQMPGFMVLLRSAGELGRSKPVLQALQELEVPFELIDATRARWLEPALHLGTRLHAAIHLPQDGVGNCRLFAHALRAEAQRHGAQFRFNTPVLGLRPGKWPTVKTAKGADQAFDGVVVCAGAQAAALLRGIGARLPLAAVYGYSITAAVRHLDGQPDPAPRTALLDLSRQVSITRLGQRVRVAGGAEIGGSVHTHDSATLRLLYAVLEDWFPGAALTQDALHWKGARPMLPDGPPVLGASGAEGIWLNLGHGAAGWTMACGSARVLAELVAGRPAPLDVSRLGVARLKR